MNNNNSPKRPMTPQEKAAYDARKKAWLEKRRAEHEAELRIQEENRKRRILVSIFVITIVIAVIAIVVGITVFMHRGDPKTPKSITYNIEGTKTSVAYKDASHDGQICIDVSALRDILGLTESRDRVGVVEYTSRSGNKAVFVNGQSTVSVNGMNIPMPSAAFVEGDVCYIPIETASYIFSGINIIRGNSTVTVRRNDETVEILAKSTDPLNMVIKFKTDLSSYEKYMNPEGSMRDAFLVLVNKEHAIPENYNAGELETLSYDYCQNDNTNKLNIYAAEALKAMLKELWASTKNTEIIGTSGMRTHEYQVYLFNKYKEEERNSPENAGKSDAEIEEIVAAYSARPGHSEHETGLCMDLVDTSSSRGDVVNYSDTGCFTDRKTFEWLKANSWKFGFILRYPEDKVGITGYSYESWHYRFVGRYHAEKMYRTGLTLDQYIETIS